MTRSDHLLVILAEECAEVAQRVSKALRFGLQEVQEGQELTNAERITQELNDFHAAYAMLCEDGTIPIIDLAASDAKRLKVEKFLDYSKRMGRLTQSVDVPHMKAFPLMQSRIKSVPWDLAKKCEAQMETNHYQSMERLANRGGLDPVEFYCAYMGRCYHGKPMVTKAYAEGFIDDLLLDWPTEKGKFEAAEVPE